MIFDHEKAFVKQILIYLDLKEYNHASGLSGQFAEKFPQSVMAHYLNAKSLYWNRNFPAALASGHRAFNLAESSEDRIATAILLACICYELKRFSKGYEVLLSIENLHDERLEKALIIFSLCMNEPETALMHVDELYKINKTLAGEFVDRFINCLNRIVPMPAA